MLPLGFQKTVEPLGREERNLEGVPLSSHSGTVLPHFLGPVSPLSSLFKAMTYLLLNKARMGLPP